MAASWATAAWLPAIAASACFAACLAKYSSLLACEISILRPSYWSLSESTWLESCLASATSWLSDG